MAAVHSHIGRAAEPADFPQAELTTEFQYYADGVENGFTGNPDKIEDVEILAPEAEDNYVYKFSLHRQLLGTERGGTLGA